MLEEIYLVRHAAPDRSLGVPYNILPGPPLTSIGRAEAVQAANWLFGRGVEYVFASPFARTSATADTIVDQLGVPISYIDALREGAPGESEARVRERIAGLLTQLDDGPLRRVALVTHGVCVKTLLLHTTADRISLAYTYDYGNCAPTAGIWYGVRGDQMWRWELAFRPVATGVLAPVL